MLQCPLESHKWEIPPENANSAYVSNPGMVDLNIKSYSFTPTDGFIHQSGCIHQCNVYSHFDGCS